MFYRNKVTEFHRQLYLHRARTLPVPLAAVAEDTEWSDLVSPWS